MNTAYNQCRCICWRKVCRWLLAAKEQKEKLLMLDNLQHPNKESEPWSRQTHTQHLKILLESGQDLFVLSVKTHVILKSEISRLKKEKERDTAWREK